MSLVGIICPYDNTYQSFDTCINCHERGGARNCDAPVALLKVMRDNDSTRKDAGVSASTLTGCAREQILQQRYPYYEAVESGWNKARGTWVHEMIEADHSPRPGLIRERRIEKYINVDDEHVRLTGKPDEVDAERGMLIDYKSAESLPREPKIHHEVQFNIYAWLLNGGMFIPEREPVNIIIKGGGMHYLTWRTKDPFRKVAYPVYETDAIEELIRMRMRPILHAQKTETVPTCNALYRFPGKWRCGCEKLMDQLIERGVVHEKEKQGVSTVHEW